MSHVNNFNEGLGFSSPFLLFDYKKFKIIEDYFFCLEVVYLSHPALSITAKLRNIDRQIHVALFKEASALLALVNIELPLAAMPPIPSPFGLCSRTRSTRSKPNPIQVQESIVINMIYYFLEFERTGSIFLNLI